MKGLEESILDYFVVCDKILPFVTEMIIDEDQENPLTDYCTRNKSKRAIDSDHFTLRLDLSLKFYKQRTERVEQFNFRNKDCLEQLRIMTTNTSNLSEQFLNNLPLQTQVKKWDKNLNSIFHQTFRKIRVSTPKRQSQLSELIETRNNLKKKLSQIRKSEEDEKETVDKLEDIEKVISEGCAATNRNLVVENVGHLSSTPMGCGKLKRKSFPNMQNICLLVRKT